MNHPSVLFPHQEAGVSWLRAHPRGGLFDEQGLGKTAQTIVAWKLDGLKRMLVVAPTSVALNWAREIRRWAPEFKTQVLARLDERVLGLGQANVIVVTHGMLLHRPLLDNLRCAHWDEIVLDEGHQFRNPTAKRTQRFFLGKAALCRRAPRCKVLTGTPVPNNPSELWCVLAGLAPERLRDKQNNKLLAWHSFRDRFCELEETPFGVKVVGVRNAAELRQRLDGFYLRRMVDDHLALPPIRVGTVSLDGTAPGIERYLDSELSDDDDELLDEIVERPGFSAWRHECGCAKVPAAVELLRDDFIAGMNKVVVFAWHLDVIDRLSDGLDDYEQVIITGGLSARERDARVQRFQNDPTVRVCIAQLQAGGVGINLHAADNAVFVEASFVPGDNAQCISRVRRIGQTRPVLIRFLSLAGSTDEIVAEVLARKAQMIREVLQ